MRYLSDEWLSAADKAISGLTPVTDDVVVGFSVDDGPHGPRRYSVRLGPDRVAITNGLDAAKVVLNLDWDLAIDIATGAASAQRAFLDGRLRLGGDVNTLLGSGPALAAYDDRLAALRATTNFGGR